MDTFTATVHYIKYFLFLNFNYHNQLCCLLVTIINIFEKKILAIFFPSPTLVCLCLQFVVRTVANTVSTTSYNNFVEFHNHMLQTFLPPVYIDIGTNANDFSTLTFTTSANSFNRLWDIKVTQVETRPDYKNLNKNTISM